MQQPLQPSKVFQIVEFSKNQLETIFDHLEPMCLVNDEFKIIRINRAMADFVTADFKECIGKHLKDVFVEWDHTLLSNHVDLVLSSRRPIQINDYSLVERGKKGWFEIIFYPVTNQNKVDECVIYFKNITELFLTKKILLQQYKKLEEQQMIVENKNALLVETRNSLDLKHQAIMDELSVAREVQRGLMPTNLPEIPGVDCN